MKAIGQAIYKAYYWLWHDLLKRPEPFTYSMRRNAKANPWPWVLIPAGLGLAWYALVTHLWGII